MLQTSAAMAIDTEEQMKEVRAAEGIREGSGIEGTAGPAGLGELMEPEVKEEVLQQLLEMGFGRNRWRGSAALIYLFCRVQYAAHFASLSSFTTPR
jgi:hypothetical protein